MKTAILNRTLCTLAVISALACKKKDNSELDRAGASSDPAGTEMPGAATDESGGLISSDTISGGKEGINGSGIGSGNPNSPGTNDTQQK